MTDIDRIAPQQRPSGHVVMRPGWHHLLFLHWAAAPASVQALLPPGLELDLYEGRAWVGLVPFSMTRVRPHWAPSAGRSLYENFHETNVRTYVHHDGKPGVWFFSLDAANPLAVAAARLWYKLPYFHARMTLEQQGDTLHYNSQRLWPRPLPAACDIAARPQGEAFEAAPHSLEHFLAERYILYSFAGGRLFRGHVHHQPYRLQRAEVVHCEENLLAAAGIARRDEEPHALYAQNVDVEIFGIETALKPVGP